MKCSRSLVKVIIIIVFVILAEGVRAQAKHLSDLESMDLVDISLLTCSPGSQIWSLYGHTAIRIEDKGNGADIVVNYGMFNFHQKNFILRFVFGRTDYEMGIEPFNVFVFDYAKEGRGVVQQRLSLTREDKMAIIQAITRNYEPGNRVYRYNYFYDNCTTRARDILINNISGETEYSVDPSVKTSYRDMIHQWNEQHRWARFGNDLLLGLQADSKTDYRQQQFLPDSLRKDFAEARIVEAGGKKRPLVDSTFTVLNINKANAGSKSSIWDTITPNMLFSVLLVVTAVMFFFELRRKRTFWLYDVTLLTLDGLCGLVLVAMLFSEHPTVRVNLQMLLLNPLSIIFVYPVGNSIVKHRFHNYWNVLLAFIIVFMICGFFQEYAEGMYALACTLLLRCIINRQLYSSPKKGNKK